MIKIEFNLNNKKQVKAVKAVKAVKDTHVKKAEKQHIVIDVENKKVNNCNSYDENLLNVSPYINNNLNNSIINDNCVKATDSINCTLNCIDKKKGSNSVTNPHNFKNLDEGKRAELQEKAQKGRKRSRNFKDTLIKNLEQKPTAVQKELVSMITGCEDEDLENNRDCACKMIIHKAITGDTKAFEICRDSIGEAPKHIIESKNVNLNIEADRILEKFNFLNEEL